MDRGFNLASREMLTGPQTPNSVYSALPLGGFSVPLQRRVGKSAGHLTVYHKLYLRLHKGREIVIRVQNIAEI